MPLDEEEDDIPTPKHLRVKQESFTSSALRPQKLISNNKLDETPITRNSEVNESSMRFKEP
jgi:hypothetical protein